MWLAILLLGCAQTEVPPPEGAPASQAALAVSEALEVIREIEERAREVQGLCDEMRGLGNAPPRDPEAILSDLQTAVRAARESGELAQLAIGRATGFLRASEPHLGP